MLLLAGAVYVVTHEWALGSELCDVWTSSDVLCCTASILHLVAIALDRWVCQTIIVIIRDFSEHFRLTLRCIWYFRMKTPIPYTLYPPSNCRAIFYPAQYLSSLFMNLTRPKNNAGSFIFQKKSDPEKNKHFSLLTAVMYMRAE